MSLVGLAAQHSQLALCPLMERRAPARRASECGIAARGATRTFGQGLRRSTVAHFARKVRGTNIVAAKHELKIQQSNAPERWPCSLRVRGPHFASKVSYNAGAATDDYSGPTHIFDARALLPNYNSFYERPISHDGEYHSPSSSESSVSVFLPFICSSSSGVYSSS